MNLPTPSLSRAVRRLALAALLAGLSACVAFERAPVAELRCDPDLAGTWTVKAGGNLSKTVRIDARCHTEDWPGMDDRPVALDLSGFAIGQDRYIALTPEQAQRAIGADAGSLAGTAPKGSVFLVLYRLTPNGLDAWLPDSQRALDAIARGGLAGRRLQDRFALVQGTPEQLRDTLAQRLNLLYDTDRKAMVFQRAKAARQDSP
ncbi:hypothetical protein SAMN04487939_1083 [Lysobacter sp. yr284]|uniref:hypothetical protein n=1 Tax=Lysobacter sp. yr284 TaxID=1761791 RepID=UPI000894EDA2|nr:hypothetical protein [Lysobacter sp. yr284]SDY89188.1 hypothetical protein SAMN04487939_1083 [Lysobacter sp. yr284]